MWDDEQRVSCSQSPVLGYVVASSMHFIWTQAEKLQNVIATGNNINILGTHYDKQQNRNFLKVRRTILVCIWSFIPHSSTSPTSNSKKTSYAANTSKSDQVVWSVENRCMVFTQAAASQALQIHHIWVVNEKIHLGKMQDREKDQESESSAKQFKQPSLKSWHTDKDIHAVMQMIPKPIWLGLGRLRLGIEHHLNDPNPIYDYKMHLERVLPPAWQKYMSSAGLKSVYSCMIIW